MTRFTLLLALFAILFSPLSFAQEDAEQAPPDKPTQLRTIVREIGFLEGEVAEHQKNLASATKEDAPDIAEELSDLQKRLKRARISFVATAADTELQLPDTEAKAKPQKRDLMQEAQQLLEPLFDAIHRVSEKPRRVEAYRSKIFNLSESLGQANKAIAGLDQAIKTKAYPEFEAMMVSSKQSLEHTRDDLQVRVDGLQRQLSQEEGDHRTVMQVVSSQAQEFFSSKGKHLGIAILVFVFVFWLLHFLKKFIFGSHLFRTKLHAIARPLHVLYGALSACVSVGAVLFTLHFLNDLFLATIVMLLVFGLVWSFKAIIKTFVSEVKLIMNLGSVKQGERVTWQGLPWMVKRLGFRSELINEALQGGAVMLPAKELTPMLSRPSGENEPWFPSNVGDFVQLDDGVYGQVLSQSPEQVVIGLYDAKKYYSTSSYLSKNPYNHSVGFDVGVDVIVRGAKAPSEEDKKRIESEIRSKLSPKTSSGDFKNLEVFVGATANSARVWARMDCAGKLAGDRDNIKRELYAIASEAIRK